MVCKHTKNNTDLLEVSKLCGEILQRVYPESRTAHELAAELKGTLSTRALTARLRVLFRKFKSGSESLPFVCERSGAPSSRLVYRWAWARADSPDKSNTDDSSDPDWDVPSTPPQITSYHIDSAFPSPSKVDIDMELRELDLALKEIDEIFA